MNEWTLLDILRSIKKYLIRIILVVLVCVSGVFILALFMPKVYRAEALILPKMTNTGMSFSSQAMDTISGSNLSDLFSAKCGATNILIYLNSRTFHERVLARFDTSRGNVIDLKTIADPSTLPPPNESSKKSIEWTMKIIEDSGTGNGLTVIAVESNDPDASAFLANGIVDELQEFVNDNMLTDTKKEKFFLVEQLEKNRKELLETSKELSTYYQNNRISPVESKVSVDVSEPYEEVPIMAQKMTQQLHDMRKQILDSKSVQDVPQQVYLQYLTMKKELLVKMNTFMQQHYESIKIEEFKKSLSFKVIDPAFVPKVPFKPKIKLMVILTFLTTFIGASVVFAIYDYYMTLNKKSA